MEHRFADIHKSFGLFVTLYIRQYHVLWYAKSGQSQETLPSGTYIGDEQGVPATLTLRPDHSFEQLVAASGVSRRAHGIWSLGDDGAINFSEDFLKTSGEPLSADEIAIARNPQPSVQLADRSGKFSKQALPAFHKKMF